MSEYVVELKNATKRFPGVVALKNMQLSVKPGEILGLIGENGSGKSTVSSIIAGMQPASSGEMFYKGKLWKPATMLEAQKAGIGMIVQEAGTIANISVAENIFLGNYDKFKKGPIINKVAMISEARKALEKIGVTNINPALPARHYDMQERKLIEIAKCMYNDPELLIVEYKDDATAFNGEKRGTIAGKGVINNRVTNHLMTLLEEQGVPTHFVRELSDRETLVKKVTIVPLEVIVRNISAGSFAKRYGVEEGIVFDAPTIEFSYKNDSLGDPLINSYHALALKLATAEELEQIKALAFRVNDLLKGIMKGIGIDLVDFKLEFGRLPDGSIVLADEISPDTCRLWDETTHEKLDKDRFRRDLGNVEGAYQEILRRMLGA